MMKFLTIISFVFIFLSGRAMASAPDDDDYSKNLIDSLEQRIASTNNLRDQGQYYLEIAEEHAYVKSFAEAIIQIDNAIICAEKIENYNFLAQCLVRKSYIYINSSRDIKLRAKKIAPVISDLITIMDKVTAPVTRASIYTLQGVQVEIEHDYDDSDEMFEGLISFQKKAIAELDLQQDTIKGMDLISDRNYKRLEISSALISWNKFDEATVYLNEVLQSEPSRLSPVSTLFVNLLANQLLVELYHGQGRFNLLNPIIDSTLYYCNALPEKSYDRYKQNAFELVHKVLFDIGDYQKAYAVQKQFYDLRELDFNESEILALGKAESNLKMMQDSVQQAQIVLDKNSEIAAQSEQNTWLLSVASLLLVGFITVFFLLRKINSSKKLIEEQNAQVNEALYEKGLLLKEVHHRVKNNMQLVSSLLELQSEFATDEFAKKTLNQANDRIKALALSHQNLYQNEDYENIEINEYFDQIIYHLLAQVNCKTTIDVPPNFLINIERGQVLGFIINELIINSLKYAWVDSETDRHISFSIKLTKNEIAFVYQDNGVGFPDGFSLSNNNSLGYTLIPSFVKRQLKGTISCVNDNGAVVHITFPNEV